MTLFYRGAAIGTYWHGRNAETFGFTPQQPGLPRSLDSLITHIVDGTVSSPYVSLTRSYGIAFDYAVGFSRKIPSRDNPAFVYQVEIVNPLPIGLLLLDPIYEIVSSFPSPGSSFSYQHNGNANYLLGVVSPGAMGRYLRQRVRQPPPGGGTPSSPSLTRELQAIVRALRDAEILAFGTVPDTLVRARHNVW